MVRLPLAKLLRRRLGRLRSRNAPHLRRPSNNNNGAETLRNSAVARTCPDTRKLPTFTPRTINGSDMIQGETIRITTWIVPSSTAGSQVVSVPRTHSGSAEAAGTASGSTDSISALLRTTTITSRTGTGTAILFISTTIRITTAGISPIIGTYAHVTYMGNS